MIAYLDGRLVEGGTEPLLDVGGVGFSLQVPERTASRLPAVGQSVRLWTHLVTREEAWALYGFGDRDELAMFRLLISVAGIGPKLALGILSGAAPNDLALWLRTGDEKSLAGLPGIGRKSAARLVVELGQRVPDRLLGYGQVGVDSLPLPQDAGNLEEAIAILGAMGLPLLQAERALQAARLDQDDLTEDLEAWVKTALTRL